MRWYPDAALPERCERVRRADALAEPHALLGAHRLEERRNDCAVVQEQVPVRIELGRKAARGA